MPELKYSLNIETKIDSIWMFKNPRLGFPKKQPLYSVFSKNFWRFYFGIFIPVKCASRCSSSKIFYLKHTYSDSPYMNLSSIFLPHPFPCRVKKTLKVTKTIFRKISQNRNNLGFKFIVTLFGVVPLLLRFLDILPLKIAVPKKKRLRNTNMNIFWSL